MKNGNAGGGGNNSQPKHDSNRELTTMSLLFVIGGFNQRQDEALSPQIFLTLSRFVFTVQTRKWGQFILRKMIEIVAT